MDSSVSYATNAMVMVLQLSLPPILVASIVGIVFSLFQAITQLQEQTLSFGVKLLAVGTALFLMSDWLCGEILRFSKDIFDTFQTY